MLVGYFWGDNKISDFVTIVIFPVARLVAVTFAIGLAMTCLYHLMSLLLSRCASAWRKATDDPHHAPADSQRRRQRCGGASIATIVGSAVRAPSEMVMLESMMIFGAMMS